MLLTIMMLVHAFLGLGLIVLVLLQQGKGMEAGGSFSGMSSGGASGSLFGSRGSANALSRTTAVFATLFFANNILLGYAMTRAYRPVSELLQSPPLASVSQKDDNIAHEALGEPEIHPDVPQEIPAP